MRATGWRMAAVGGIAAGLLALLWAGPVSSGGFMSKASSVKEKASKDAPKDTPKDTPKETAANSERPTPPSAVYKGEANGPAGFFGHVGKGSGASWGASSRTLGNIHGPGATVSGTGARPFRTVSLPRPSDTEKPKTTGGLFRRVDRDEGKPATGVPVLGKYYGSSQGGDLRPILQSRPGGFFATVDRVERTVQSKRSGSGYFSTVQNLQRRLHRPGRWDTCHWWWYYPYDFRFYHWYYGFYDPFDPHYPFAVYVYRPRTHYYYWYPRPVVLVTPPAFWITLWVEDRPHRYSDDYYPYLESVRGSLGRAIQDIERAWRSEDISLLMRHVHPEWDIRVLYREEYSHTLSARQFEELTRDAFETIRTESFRITSVKRHRDEGTAVAKGVHALRDPNGERRVVYVVYLLVEARDRYGDWDWFIREVGQSPEPY